MNTKSALMKITKSPQSNFIEQPPRRRICTSWIVPLLLLWMLPAGLGLMLAGRVTAQTFTTIYSFQGNGDGGRPSAGLVLSGNTLYGTAMVYGMGTSLVTGRARVRPQHRWHGFYEPCLNCGVTYLGL